MDDNRKRFEARLRVLDEVPGVTARSRHSRLTNSSRRKVLWEKRLRPIKAGVRIALVLLAFFIAKAGIAEITGTESYDIQVASMANEDGWESVAAVFMQRGPLMRWAEPAVAKIMDVERSRVVASALDEGVLRPAKGAEE